MKVFHSFAICLLLSAFALAQGGMQPGPGTVYAVSGGGGPVAFVGTEYASGFPDDTKPAVTSSFTPNAGSRLLVVAALLGPNSTWANSIAISDSQSLTWTPLADDQNAGSYGGQLGYRIWISSSAAASSMTVTITSTADQWRTIVVVGEVTGTDGSITGLVQDDTAPLSGGYTATLSAAPDADDASVFIRMGDSGSSGSYSMSGWTTVADVTTPFENILFVAIRTGSTSTSATLSGTRLFDNYGLDAVFNLKAG